MLPRRPPRFTDVTATKGQLPMSRPWTAGNVPPGWPVPSGRVLRGFSGPIAPVVLVPGTTYYRVVGAGSRPNGSWWTPIPPTLGQRPALAIKGSWNSMTGVVEFTPTENASIRGWQGAAAAQSVTMPDGAAGYLPGGASQIWMPAGSASKDTGRFTIRPMPGA